MKWTIQVWLSLLTISLCAPPKPAPAQKAPEPATLRWNNGETTTGEIVEGSASDLTWKSPLFDEPMVLGWHALRRIDQPRASIPVTDTFSIAFLNGDVIHGDIVSLTETTINIHSSRHGDAAIKRTEVSSIRRLRGGNLVYSGPAGDVDWTLSAIRKDVETEGGSALRQIKVPWLVTGRRGALLMPYWNGGASLKVTLPEKTDLEFLVRSSTRPSFLFSFFGDKKQRLRVETWDDQVVLVAGKSFKLIRKLAETERDVGLRLCWNRPARTCSVFALSGEPLIEWQVPEDPDGNGSGVQLQSSGRDLSLDALRIRAWDGQAPARYDLARPRVETVDGRFIEGNVREGTAESVTLTEAPEKPASVVPLNQVAAIVFSTEEPEAAQQPNTLSFADGTRITGRTISVKAGRVTLDTSISEQPLESALENLRQWLIRVPKPEGSEAEQPLAKLDRIIGLRSTLHGKLSGVGDDSPRWVPVGGLRPVKPSKELAQEIIRAITPGDDTPSAPALIYTTSGDVLPGRMRSLDQKHVDLETNLIQNTSLPIEYLDAIQFGASTGNGVQGFNDPGWRVLKGDAEKVRRPGDLLIMEPETSIGHPAAMLSSEINFEFRSSGFSTLRLRMFCAGLEASKSISFAVMRMGERLTAGIEGEEGQFNEEAQTSVSSSDPVPIRILIQKNDFALYVNGGLVQKYPIGAARRTGAGLIIEPTSMWGNSVNSIELAKFSTKSDPGMTWLPEVSGDTKVQALTVPRFRKENPPRHALLARNGDVLRGEIESATATHFGFRSGLETLRVPRDRVKAAIWLKKPDPNAPPPDPGDSARGNLDRKITQHINYGGVQLSSLVDFLMQEVDGLKFKLPKKQDQRGLDIQLGGQTVGEALDEICRVFGLTYRIDKDGTIVFEKPTQAPRDLVQRVYWMKDSKLPGDGSAKKILADKGISFPENASLVWQPAIQELTMTNTAANHEKLAQVLSAEFGGSIGSPTHWLILTNGGRIGLQVEKFDAEWVSGKHPRYGECKVPIKDVFTIRTTPPEATAAMRSLADWHLVYAPEPVLPESGGESSPMLGKEAKTFKLPLIAGGDFDLAREKGKVVVLDFWASWCGPCIKSLPGLIEAMSAFPADRVKFIGVNQGEPPDQVKTFLETRRWKLDVALDSSQTVGRQYEVEGIPHTVVIAPDGKIAFVQSGASPEGETIVANAVKQLLSGAVPDEGAR
jgi:thiol-disulfide isomerase/thioredoxin